MGSIYDADPVSLSADARMDALLAAEHEIARVQARQLRLIAAIADDPYADTVAPKMDKEYFKESLRVALGESAVSLNDRIYLARDLVNRLPATLTALEGGQLTLRHARHLAEAVRPLTDHDAGEVEAAALPFAAGRGISAFCRKVRREVLNCDSRHPQEQLDKARADRTVRSRPDGPAAGAMTHVSALLPAEGAQLLMNALDLMADHTGPDDPRTRPQRRADALMQLGADALAGYTSCPRCAARNDNPDRADSVARNDNGHRADSVVPDNNRGQTGIAVPDDNARQRNTPRKRDVRPSIHVTVALSTLLGYDEQPAELDGHGPIPATLARRIAADNTGTWRRLVTDDLGHLIDYGRSTYTPPKDLHDFVVARDRTCRFPTCTQPAERCETDHSIAWTDGGKTNADNLSSLCPRHHHTKHDTRWRMEHHPDGTIVWTSPHGHTHTVHLDPYPVDHTHDRYVQNDNAEKAENAGPADSNSATPESSSELPDIPPF